MKLSLSSFSKYALYQMCSLLLLLLSTNAQTNSSKIPIGSSLKAGGVKSSWTSASGNFAFGFRPVKDEGFLLAIWFNELPEKTVVWSANRNQLVQSGSVVKFSTIGGLVLNDQSGKGVWSADPVGTGVSYAAMLETGNFVLAENDSAYLWQSFDHPTDTILPSQVLTKGGTLTANYLETNFSEGRFMLRLDTTGDLVMYTTDYPFKRANQAYLSSSDNTNGSGSQLVYNQSGFVFVASDNDSLLYPVFRDAESTEDFYQRATIDFDGVFRQYVYPRGNKSARAWTLSWSTLSFTPPNICLAITGDVGSGACGFNSYCTMEDGQAPKCLCPSGYSFLDPNDERKGCKQNFAGQLCDDASQDTDQYGLVSMTGIDWPRSDYEHYDQTTEDWCREACLSDCFCAVAIIRDGNCWKKKLPLYNGRLDPKDLGKALMKVRTSGFIEPKCCKKKDRPAMLIGGSVILGSSIFLNFLLLVAAYVFILRFGRGRQQPPRVVPGQKIRSFTYSELESATGGFKEEVGSGSFGNVYKGTLPNDNKVVAVKKLNRMERDGEDGFDTEVSVIGGTNHRNLVQLLGFCNEGQHRLLIYEFMSNGSLANFLLGATRPNWFRRTQIANGIARGLFYLHEECTSQIIHCDIKPQNILLDESLAPRISDFGLSKFLKIDQTQTTTNIRGTKGYVAPEWFRSMPITSKVDVYSFGIVLLELVCCRRNVEPDIVGEDQIILADWTFDCYRDGTLQLLVERDEEATDDMNRVKKYLMVAMWCIQEDPSLRPTMKKVLQMLEGSVQVPAPPDPASFISQI